MFPVVLLLKVIQFKRSLRIGLKKNHTSANKLLSLLCGQYLYSQWASRRWKITVKELTIYSSKVYKMQSVTDRNIYCHLGKIRFNEARWAGVSE